MSNIDKQWLQQKITEMEEHRDLFPGDLDDDHASVLSAFRIALASLEAEAVAEVCEGFILRYIGHGPAPKYGVRIGDRLYTAPPAPVFPDEMAISDDMNLFQKSFAQGHNACRAAMLHGKE